MLTVTLGCPWLCTELLMTRDLGSTTLLQDRSHFADVNTEVNGQLE